MSRRRAILAVRSHQARLEAAQEHQEAEELAPETEELDRDALAAEYEDVFGKPPRSNMKTETIAARIAENDDAD